MKSDRRIEIVKNAYIKIREDMEQYIKCLNVIGNNYKYSLRNQLRIFETNPNATACAEFNFWRKHFNRSVKMKQQGIPIYKRKYYSGHLIQKSIEIFYKRSKIEFIRKLLKVQRHFLLRFQKRLFILFL